MRTLFEFPSRDVGLEAVDSGDTVVGLEAVDSGDTVVGLEGVDSGDIGVVSSGGVCSGVMELGVVDTLVSV